MTLEAESPWTYEHIDDITSGVDISKRPEVIDKSSMVDIENLYFRDARLVADTGYTTWMGTVRGTPRAQFQFFKKSGSSENILITNDTIYTEGNDEWQYIASSVSTTVAIAGVATDTSIDVADITGFADNDYIGIELDDGTQHQTQINGTPAGSTITFDDALPSGAAIANAVVKAVVLNGIDDDQVSITIMPAFDYLIFTNNQDVVQYYDGTSVQAVPNLPSSGNTKCKAVTVFVNHLLLIHTTEGGTAYPQRVRWSDTADPTEWTANNAGYEDQYDTEDFCVVGVPLGPYMMIYKERTIIRMEHVGSTERLFNFDPVVSGEGAVNLDSVVDIGTEHIFIGNSNIYRYNGGFDVDPVGDKVWNRLFGKDKEVNPNQTGKSICIYIEELDEVWYFYADVTATFPNNIARLKLENDAWTFRTLGIEITGFGFYQTTSTLRWNELIGSWLVQIFKWGGSATQANAPTTVLLSATGGNQAYQYDYISGDDNGATISWEAETKDFYHPQYEIRLNWLDFRAKGSSLIIEYSLDGGNSWSNWATATLDSNYQRYRYYWQVVSDRIRFKFKGSGPGFGIEWYGFQFMPESIH